MRSRRKVCTTYMSSRQRSLKRIKRTYWEWSNFLEGGKYNPLNSSVSMERSEGCLRFDRETCYSPSCQDYMRTSRTYLTRPLNIMGNQSQKNDESTYILPSWRIQSANFEFVTTTREQKWLTRGKTSHRLRPLTAETHHHCQWSHEKTYSSKFDGGRSFEDSNQEARLRTEKVSYNRTRVSIVAW